MDKSCKTWGIFVVVAVLGIACSGEGNVAVEKRPFILSSPSYLSVLVGDSVDLPCKVQNIGKSVVIWKRSRGGILFSGAIRVDRDPRIQLADGSMLQISLVTPEYEGEYACEVSGYPDLRLSHKIRVLVPPSITMDPEDGHVIVRKGDPVTLRCMAAGFPEPVITWTFLHGVLPGGVTRKQGPVLSIGSADPMHSGTYECSANNEVGEADTAHFKLKVLYPPSVLVRPEWAHGGEGNDLEFTCTCDSEPPSTLRWTRRDGGQLPDDGHVSVASGQARSSLVLRIRKMRREHLNGYTCTANNSVGISWKTVEVSGLAEPVLFRNSSSAAECETCFLLRWTVKSFSPVTEFLLRIRRHKSPEPWISVTIPAVENHGQSLMHSHAYNVTGLEPGSRYEAVLQAMNSAGWNRPSETFVFETGGEPHPLDSDTENDNQDVSSLSLYDVEGDLTELSTTQHVQSEEEMNEEDGTPEQVQQSSANYFALAEWTIACCLLLLASQMAHQP